MGAIAKAIFGDKDADAAVKAAQINSQAANYVDPTIKSASDSALAKATAISNRAYTPFQGQRVAGLTGNEQQAGNLAAQYGDNLSASMRAGGPTTKQLSAFTNPYLDQVLGNQKRVIGDEFGRQSAELGSNEAAMNAFRTGRSDLARSRLDANRMRALGDAEASGRASAFDEALKGYFTNQNQQQGAFQTAQQALGQTGLQQRAVNQAGLDVNYGNFLEKRDWDTNNLGPLLNAVSVARGNSSSSGQSTQSVPGKNYWGAAVGLIGSAISAYGNYSSKQNTQNSANLNSAVNNANNSGAFDWGGSSASPAPVTDYYSD